MAAEIALTIAPIVAKLLKPVIEEWFESRNKPDDDWRDEFQNLAETFSLISGDSPDVKPPGEPRFTHEELRQNINEIGESVSAEASPVKRSATTKKLFLKSKDRRFALARMFVDGSPGVAIIVENEISAGVLKATEFAKALSDKIDVLVTGEVYTGGRVEKIYPPHVPGIAPGTSICQHNGWAGTLGALVQFSRRRGARKVPGFTSAAHVLEIKDEEKKAVYSPGRPDADVQKRNEIGEVVNYNALSSFHDIDDPDAIFNTADIGIAKLHDDARTYANTVRNPKNGNEMLISGVMDEDEIIDRLAENGHLDVYMIGRTSGFSRGRLRAVGSTPVPLRIGRQKLLYAELGFVLPLAKASQFSRPGDSGALVYSEDGKALGFVVGGSDRGTTLIHLAGACLDSMEAELI